MELRESGGTFGNVENTLQEKHQPAHSYSRFLLRPGHRSSPLYTTTITAHLLKKTKRGGRGDVLEEQGSQAT